MKKTSIARKAHEIYNGNNKYLLVPYFVLLFSAFCIPAMFINYLYTSINRAFFILIPFYVYFAFPVFLGAIISFFLMGDSFVRFFSRKQNAKNNDLTFEDLIFKLFGFRIKDDKNGK